MPIDYAYPPQLAQFLRHAWESTPDAPPLPDHAHLDRVLTVAYQASLLRDEDRTVRARIAVAPPHEFDPQQGPPAGLHPLVFDEPVPFTPDQLRRLAVAAKYHRALVGVSPVPGDGSCHIWGTLQSGPGWIQMAQGGRGPAPTPPPSTLVVRILGPGRIAVDRGLVTLAELRGGVVGGPGMDLFRSKWMPGSFASSRAELAQLHAAARASAEATGERWADLAPEVVRLVSQAMVRRFLAAMVAAHHGGAVIILPPETAEDAVRGSGPLKVKYAFRDAEPRRRYRRLILGLMRAIARAGGAAGLTVVDASTYASLNDEETASTRDAIFEMSQLIAALSEVDGAVVMTKRFELLGFGAEIVGDLPDVRRVARALDLEAHEHVFEPVLADGTRHRSAYRLCSRIPEALALVVSQDGGVRFVSTHHGEVTFWDHAIEMLDG
jgi:DNA integrity scanning protein DisA with diadenylate cyclase activity